MRWLCDLVNTKQCIVLVCGMCIANMRRKYKVKDGELKKTLHWCIIYADTDRSEFIVPKIWAKNMALRWRIIG